MKYRVETIRAFGEEALANAGLPLDEAAICMDSFIQADLRGISTHGVTHLKGYCDRLANGTAVDCSHMTIEETGPSSLVVDAGHAVGMAAAMKVMERCVEKASVSGSCFATVRNGCHYGFGAYFPMKAAEHNMIAFCVANTPALVVPFGGADPMLGTNPITVVVPAGNHEPLVVDMATSIVAKGKISLALKEGKEIPPTWAVDKDGVPTTDPAAANVGALLPMGGPKGYGLGLLVSVLSCALAGGAMDTEIPRFWEEPEIPTNIGYFMGCIDISKFADPDEFARRADALFDAIKASRPAQGFKSVMIPGEIESHAASARAEEGIDFSEKTLAEFKALAERFELDYPF